MVLVGRPRLVINFYYARVHWVRVARLPLLVGSFLSFSLSLSLSLFLTFIIFLFPSETMTSPFFLLYKSDRRITCVCVNVETLNSDVPTRVVANETCILYTHNII